MTASKASAFGDMLPATGQRLPLAERGLQRLMPTVVMVIWRLSAGSRGEVGR